MAVALAYLHVRDRFLQITAMGEKPLHALGEGGDSGQHRVVDHFDGQQRHKADERPQPHRDRHAVGAEMVVIEAILFVPQAVAPQRIEGVGNVDEMFEEFRGDIFVGRDLRGPARCAMASMVVQYMPIQAVPSACSRKTPCGRGRERSKTPMLSRPKNPPAKMCLP